MTNAYTIIRKIANMIVKKLLLALARNEDAIGIQQYDAFALKFIGQLSNRRSRSCFTAAILIKPFLQSFFFLLKQLLAYTFIKSEVSVSLAHVSCATIKQFILGKFAKKRHIR